MNGQLSQVACPNCGKPVTWEPAQKWRPFCSERCKLIDLGEWLSEDKRIPGEPVHLPENQEDR
jgi:endogenous inhibitor of DNA gyrase (YacG/DUF329 family)